MKPKTRATLWTIAIFLFAMFSDLCFEHWSLYVLGTASVVFTIVSIVFSIALISQLLDV